MTDGGATTAFQRVRQLFEAAVDLPAAERDSYLARECDSPADTPVRTEIEQLLACDANESRMTNLLERGIEPLQAAELERVLGSR